MITFRDCGPASVQFVCRWGLRYGAPVESNDQLLLILLGAAVVLGTVGSIAYYFARYAFRSNETATPPGRELTDKKDEILVAAPEIDLVGKAKEIVPPPNVTIDAPEPVKQKSISSALEKTKLGMWGRLKGLLGVDTLPGDIRDQIEEVLYTSDLGVATVERLMEVIDKGLKPSEKTNIEQVRLALKSEMLQILNAQAEGKALLTREPGGTMATWLIVGVNGAGKTTTIGKLAYSLAQQGQRVLVAAGDTFRAAAEAQLKVWSERAKVEIFAPEGVTDPAAVAYQAMEKGQREKFDVVIIDTAGRLHTQKNLMEELKKVKRVMMKIDTTAPQETLLVLDANSGQNALVQAREFNQALELTGVILTKMDGTAKGGVALSLAVELNLPLRLIGVGEAVTDLRPFRPQEYVDAII